jgi:hypothetical protein
LGFDPIPNTILDRTLVAPATGFGLAMKTPNAIANKSLGELVQQLPSDLADPPEGVKIDDQGLFWIGYYHYLDRGKTSIPSV